MLLEIFFCGYVLMLFLLNLPEQCPFLVADTSKPQVPEGKKPAIEMREDMNDRLFS